MSARASVARRDLALARTTMSITSLERARTTWRSTRREAILRREMKGEARGGAWCSPALFESPVLASVAPWSARLARFDGFPTVSELDHALRDRLAIEPGVSLEPQVKTRRRRGPLDRDALYEVRIHRHRRVPTRERSWHDLTNALVWAAFPRSKRALCARQHAILETTLPPSATKLPSARTREQDALALLDEGGIVVLTHTRDESEARRAQEEGDEAAWRTLRAEERAAFLVFGHAMMEHALAGSLDVRGYGVVLATDDALPREREARIARADALLAAWIATTDALFEPSPWRGLSLATLFGP